MNMDILLGQIISKDEMQANGRKISIKDALSLKNVKMLVSQIK